MPDSKAAEHQTLHPVADKIPTVYLLKIVHSEAPVAWPALTRDVDKHEGGHCVLPEAVSLKIACWETSWGRGVPRLCRDCPRTLEPGFKMAAAEDVLGTQDVLRALPHPG